MPSSWLDFFLFVLTFFCFLSRLFNIAYPLLCPLDDFSSHLTSFLNATIPLSLSSLTFPSVSVIFYLALADATGMKAYPLWHLAPFLFPLTDGLWAFKRLSFRRVTSAKSDSCTENAVLPSCLAFMHVCFCVYERVYLKEGVGALRVASRWVCKARVPVLLSPSCRPCCCHAKESGAFLLLPSLSVRPWMTGAPPCSLTRLPHSKVALQLLRGSTVWSCPVWLQTKQQRDSGTTSDHQTGLHVMLTSFTRGEEDGLRHSTFCVKIWRFATMPLQSVYSTSRHFCVRVFPANFRTAPSPLWPMYFLSELVTIYTVYMVCTEYVYSCGGVRVMRVGHLTAIRCQQELPTALAPQLRSLMAIKSLTMWKAFN